MWIFLSVSQFSFFFYILHSGIEIDGGLGSTTCIKGILLDTSMDSPARSSWLNIKQYNGYFGCSTCTEPGEQLDLGPGKKKARRQCHIYPFNKEFAGTTGHAELRKHNVLKQQALVAMSQISDRGKVYVSDTLYNCVLYKVHEGYACNTEDYLYLGVFKLISYKYMCTSKQPCIILLII